MDDRFLSPNNMHPSLKDGGSQPSGVKVSSQGVGYRAVFFDLDGTLLPVDIKVFLNTYFKAFASYVASEGHDAEAFLAGLKAGIRAMAEHDDHQTNHEVFWGTFMAQVRGSQEAWMALLNRFYEYDFGKLGNDIQLNPAAARAVKTLQNKGYPLMLTTMPLFPLRAIMWRLAWAGLNPHQFQRITTYENSTSVKPRATFFAENLAAANLKGSHVLMVGNNTVEDLSSCKLGTDAYLITDNLIDPTGIFDKRSVKHGSLEDFALWVELLPPCDNPAVDVVTGLVDAHLRRSFLRDNEVSAKGYMHP